ncbi:General negative regulator of transcription subunit 2 [Cytospora mali]|uniref:General negative regulator of transcription subunit 2 n=1 Tax=Cytospora mali TaxID=578113 RepID=A0A194VYG0_CYTMA|nr:General negative regulator of transcription subunit 2 [Valsa mali]
MNRTVNNGSGWAFGGVGPMSAGGIQNPTRQLGGGATFAQSLSGSTPATPLDLSEFPQLSNNAQLSGASQQSLWGGQAARNLSGPAPRNPGPAIPQQAQQDDLFSPASRISSSQNSFRFGSQASIVQPQQPQASGGDEFPPLNRNGNGGDIGQERVANLMTGLSLGSQVGAVTSPPPAQARGPGNGLLNAVTANTRASEARSPIGARPSEGRSSITEDDVRQNSTFREDSSTSQTALSDAPGQSLEMRNSLVAIGNEGSNSKANEVPAEASSSAAQDPLAGMSEGDKWGIKGLLALMAKYPSYHALAHGMNPAELGLDLTSDAPISTQTFSLTSHEPPKPLLPKFSLPECYTVRNTQPIEQKMPNFTEETLLYMFYANPQDKHQYLAAQQLFSRGWRWHKVHCFWLTKDIEMQPLSISPEAERGYYVIWNTKEWVRERRELVLRYADLETFPDINPGPHS